MTWSHLAYVESDSDIGKRYEIKRRDDGAYGCDCTAFKFSPGRVGLGKSCKHLRAFLQAGQAESVTVVNSAVRLVGGRRGGGKSEILRETVQRAPETFTFHRALRFTDL